MPAFLVGGYIRDSLKGIATRDVDIAVLGDSSALAEELAKCLAGSYVPLGHAHQVARVVLGSEDGGWVVDLSAVEQSIEHDLTKRDFTVDAMALPIDEWPTPGWRDRVLDPFGGKADLSQGVIRAVQPGVFQDDPVRLLRAIRLAAQLGFHIDSHTIELISRDTHLISSTASERVRDELLGILSPDGAKVRLETLDEVGLLSCIIPELDIAKGVEQPQEHYWDVFDHSLHTVEGVELVTSGQVDDPITGLVPWSPETGDRFDQEVIYGHSRRTVLKLGALLHDIAKPQTKAVDAKGKTRFLGHQTIGASMSREVLHRLRISVRGTAMVCTMVENHLRPTQMCHGDEAPTPRAVYRYFRDLGDVAIDTLYLSLADHLAARGPELDMGGWQDHVGDIEHILRVGTQEQAPERMPRLVDGHDLMWEFGLGPGPLIGSLLEAIQDAQVGGDLETKEGALAWIRHRLQEDGESSARSSPTGVQS